jgi:hypothetical protein
MERNNKGESKMEIRWTTKSGAEAVVAVEMVCKSANLSNPVVDFTATVNGVVVGKGLPKRQRAGSPVFAVMGQLGMSEDIYNQIIAAEDVVMAHDTEWTERVAAHDAANAEYDRCNAATRKAMSY